VPWESSDPLLFSTDNGRLGNRQFVLNAMHWLSRKL
jgi:hypothetical protein